MRGAGVGRLHALYRRARAFGRATRMAYATNSSRIVRRLARRIFRKPFTHLDNRPAGYQIEPRPNTWTEYRGRTFKRELRCGAWMGQMRLRYKDWFWNLSSSAASVSPRPMIAAGACVRAGRWSAGFPRWQSPGATVGFIRWRNTCCRDGLGTFLAVKRVSE